MIKNLVGRLLGSSYKEPPKELELDASQISTLAWVDRINTLVIAENDNFNALEVYHPLAVLKMCNTFDTWLDDTPTEKKALIRLFMFYLSRYNWLLTHEFVLGVCSVICAELVHRLNTKNLLGDPQTFDDSFSCQVLVSRIFYSTDWSTFPKGAKYVEGFECNLDCIGKVLSHFIRCLSIKQASLHGFAGSYNSCEITNTVEIPSSLGSPPYNYIATSNTMVYTDANFSWYFLLNESEKFVSKNFCCLQCDNIEDILKFKQYGESVF